uniref:CSON013813 protein n=1 Tax=Culicoides sonorensis TaxID=179676 RepID=A0A336KNH8_CULSO
MEESLQDNEEIEIIDLEDDFIDRFVSRDLEAELTTMMELEDEEDSFLVDFNETAQTEYTCPLCKEIFVGKRAARDHVRRYFKYSCPTCHKRYFRDKYLQRHLKNAHLPAMNVKCPLCNKVFKAVNNLKQHLHLHSNELPYECGYEGCGKRFRQKPGLQQHIRYMHKRNENFCRICRKRVVDVHKHTERYHKTTKFRKPLPKQKEKQIIETPLGNLTNCLDNIETREEDEEEESNNGDSNDLLSATWKFEDGYEDDMSGSNEQVENFL